MRTSIAQYRRSANTAWLSAALCVVALAGGCESGSQSGWLGLNTQLGEPAVVSAGLQPGSSTLPPCVSLVSELEIPLVRDTLMNWAVIQPAADRPCDFAVSDQVVREMQFAKADLLIVFSEVPDWACGTPSPGLRAPRVPDRRHAQAFADFVTRFVERYDHDGRSDMPKLTASVNSYQFICEMEDIPPVDYAWWLKLFHASVKAADPKAVVVLGGLKSPGLKTFDQPHGEYPNYLGRLLADPELVGDEYPYFDVAAFHSFPGRYPGRSPFDEPIAYLRQTLASRNLTSPIWLTAYGAGSGPETQTEQAENLLKWTVRARTLGVQRAYIYCLCDCRDHGQGTLQNCGLVREDPEGRIVRKPAFDAVAKIVTELKDRPDVSFRGDGLYVLSGTGEPRYVVWKDDAVDAGQLRLRGWWSVQTVTGPKIVRQASEIRFTNSPLILERTTSPFID